MSTDRISSSASIIETMRAIARDRATGTQRGDQISTVGASPDQAIAPASPHSTAELRQRLRQLASGVNVDDAQSVHDARAPVLREILLWEFGSDFRKDAQFLPVVDAISSALDANAGFQQRFVELIAGLQKG